MQNAVATYVTVTGFRTYPEPMPSSDSRIGTPSLSQILMGIDHIVGHFRQSRITAYGLNCLVARSPMHACLKKRLIMVDQRYDQGRNNDIKRDRMALWQPLMFSPPFGFPG